MAQVVDINVFFLTEYKLTLIFILYSRGKKYNMLQKINFLHF